MNIGTKILIVDDEQEICEILKYNLMLEGYDTEIVYNAEDALNLDLSSYSLFILDIMMDNIDGFELARKLKTNPDTVYTPIIFCSALSGEDEHIMGLNLGADDYITKPFRTREVIARVKSVLRRSRVTKELSKRLQQLPSTSKPVVVPTETKVATTQPVTQSTSTYSYNELRIDENTKQCYINDEVVNLTKTEYEMLSFFMTHRNSIYSRKEIIEKIWDNANDVSNRTIDTNITRLRKKLGKYGSCITTRLGYGYGFQEQNID